jgi:multiple sugar transport system ATP-binding protein
MRAEIKRLHKIAQVTTVYVTHDQVEAMTLGDRIAVMREGSVEQLGTPDDIYSRPATRFVAEFIGSPAMNMIAGQCASDTLTAKGIDLALTPAQRSALRTANVPELTYGLRPEALSFADAGLPGTVTMLEPTGPETYALIETPVGNVIARVPGKVPHSVGERVFLRWSPEEAHLFDGKTDRRVV